MKTIKILPLIAVCVSSHTFALQSLSEDELAGVIGEGVGIVLDDLSIHSADRGDAGDFTIRLNLDDSTNPDALLVSELRLYKTGSQSGTASSGGRVGSYSDPLIMGELKQITEKHTGLIDPEGDGSFVRGNRTHTALYTAFPSANLPQLERDFYAYSKDEITVLNYIAARSDSDGFDVYSKGIPNDFFSNKASVNVGNFFTLADQYEQMFSANAAKLAAGSDAFNLHIRADNLSGPKKNLGADDQFLASIDIEGLRLYKTETFIWAHDAQGERLPSPFSNASKYKNNGMPAYANRGLAISNTLGLLADVVRINTDPQGSIAGQLELRGVNAYLPLGSADQPMSISTVQYSQTKRGTWGDENPVILPASTQLRIEIAGLPQDVKQAERGNIYIRSLHFGNGDEDEIITGKKSVYLRDRNGNVRETVNDVKHKAFVPETVTYNEQIAIYNKANPNNKLPFIPNQNVIQVRGIEVQRLVITTQDL